MLKFMRRNIPQHCEGAGSVARIKRYEIIQMKQNASTRVDEVRLEVLSMMVVDIRPVWILTQLVTLLHY